MTESHNKNRWYDKDPTLSMAISILRNTDKKNQIKVAEYIIDKLKSTAISKPNFPQNLLKVLNRRWYDHNEKLSTAMEYLRLSTLTVQQDIALEIIDLLCELDSQKTCDTNQT